MAFPIHVTYINIKIVSITDLFLFHIGHYIEQYDNEIEYESLRYLHRPFFPRWGFYRRGYTGVTSCLATWTM